MAVPRLRERRTPRHERRQGPDGDVPGPNFGLNPHSTTAVGESATRTPVAGVANPAGAPSSTGFTVAITPAVATAPGGASTTTSTATPTPAVEQISIPSNVKVVVPAVVVFVLFFAGCLAAYQVYLCRRRRAKRLAHRLPQIRVQTVSHTDSDMDTLRSTKKLIPLVADDDDEGKADSPTRPFGLPTSPRDGVKGRTAFNSATPVAVRFPTSSSGSDDKDPPLSPLPAVRLRPPKMPAAGSEANRLSVRSSSLIGARAPSIVVSPASPDMSSLSTLAPPKPASSAHPKLVTVIATYSTTLPDELPVRIGETLHVIEEYADQWCLVERVARGGIRTRGVVPVVCIQDKASLFPLKRLSALILGK